MSIRTACCLVTLFITSGYASTWAADDFFTGKSAGSPMGRRWAEKVKEREPKVKALKDKLEALRNSDKHARTPLELACPLMLESAYMAALSDQAHDVEPDGSEVFHLFLNGGDTMLDLVYMYGPKGAIVGARIDRLPSDWSVAFMANDPKTPTVRSKEGCLWGFDLGNPFAGDFLGIVPVP